MKSDKKLISEMLNKAKEIFKKFKYEPLVARCLRNLADIKFLENDNYDAKKLIDEALEIIKINRDNH
jgi:hypothetical protein